MLYSEKGTRPFWENKIAVVLSNYGFRSHCQRIIGAWPGITKEVRHEHMKVIDPDQLTGKEWAAYCAWRLTQ